MTERFQKTVVEVVERILRAARADAELLSGLRTCADEVLSLDAAPSPGEVPPVSDVNPVVAQVKATAASSPAGVPPPPVTPSRPTVQPRLPNPRPAVPFTLAGAQERLRLKAEAARWAAERGRLTDSREVALKDQDFARRERADGCYLWMLHPNGPRSQRLDHFDVIAAWYENLAEALALAERVIAVVGWSGHEVGPVLVALAKAQSALRVAVARCGGYDEDQQAVYRWLVESADRNSIYIGDGMKSSAPTDPSEWAAAAGRIQALGSAFEKAHGQRLKRERLLAVVKQTASRLTANPPDVAGTLTELAAGVDELIGAGLPPSNKELREALLPTFDRLRTLPHPSNNVRLVVREIGKYKEGRPAKTVSTLGTATAPVVVEARKLLAGRSAVLIGAEGRPTAKEPLERSLGLKELVWLKGREYSSYHEFERYIARPDVAVVLLAVRWTSHAFGEAVKFCKRHGKPLVRLTGGYGPNKVAHDIVDQASKQLKTASPS